MQDVLAPWIAALRHDLDTRRSAHLFRELREVAGPQGPTLRVDGTQYLQFSTNNYLGLASDPALVDAARTALDKYGVGAGASRLVAGSMELHHELERALAEFKGAEAALLCPTGFTANLAVLTTFAGPGDLVVSDKLNHASLLDGARYSGAECRTFPHRAYDRAAALLTRDANPRRRFLVTDTVFSMDGDIADLPAACAGATASSTLIILDEAHATGVLGEQGRGAAEAQRVESSVALSVGTLSKAFGSVGGFITGPRPAIDMLINAGRSFIYTTALPPACSAASLAALRLIQSAEGRRRRQRVLRLAASIKRELESLGFNCGQSCTPIIPILLGAPERALAAAAHLKERGIWVPAIRPPTVPRGQARLRISLMATHTDAHVEQLLHELKKMRP